MASRKFLIDGIMSLAQKLGANPSKYMGTKQNINFLGTGNYRGPDGKGTTFSGLINEDIIGSANLYKQDDIVKVIEQDMGFVTADKLNDIQLNTMYKNLKKIDEAFNPPPGPANVIDLETGTGGLNKEGLESLRETDKIKRFTQGLTTSKTAISDKIKQGIESLKTKIGKGKEGVESLDDVADAKLIEQMYRTAGPRSLDEDAGYLAEFIAEDAGKILDELPTKEQTKFINRAKNALIKNVKQYQVIDDLQKFVDDIPTRTERTSSAEKDFARMGAADFGDSVQAEGARRAVVRQLMRDDPDYFLLPPETADSISRSLDLGRSGANYPDPLIVFRNIGNFTRKELEQIDDVINESPFDDITVISERVKKFIKKIRPDGFRPGFRSGKFVKDGIAALLRLGNKKFGKDTLKVADEIDRPEAAKLRDEFRAFNERTRKLTDEEYAELQEIYGDSLPYLETVGDAEKFVAGQKAYEAAMFADYKAGKLDPKPGESGRKKLLEKKAQEAEMSGDSKLFTRDEAEELGSMKEYGGPKTDDYYKKSLGEVVPDDYNQLVNVPLERITPGILRVKYPGIPDELAELIGTDTNLQRKAEAIAAIEQALALKGAGKSADEVIAILKGEPKTKMSKGGLARILEM
jgi:hypothetical protein